MIKKEKNTLPERKYVRATAILNTEVLKKERKKKDKIKTVDYELKPATI